MTPRLRTSPTELIKEKRRFRNFILVKSLGLVFCYIPKVACTNWKCFFRKVAGCSDWNSPVLAHSRQESGLVYLSELDDIELMAVLSDPDIKFAVFVRDPVGRCLSGFVNKFMLCPVKASREWQLIANKIGQVVHRNSSQYGKPEDVPFVDFVSYLEMQPDSSLNEHWAAQTHLAATDLVKYDFVGKLNNLNEDLDGLGALIGKSIELPSPNSVGFPQLNSVQYRDRLLTPALESKLRVRFQPDYSEFNFS